MQEWMTLLDDAADAVSALVARLPRDEFGRASGVGASGLPSVEGDRLAEQAVLRTLDASGLALNVCSEEIGLIDHGAERTLVVDPVDGTTNAARGIPFYCTSLAVCRSGLADVEAGLVRNLVTGDTYRAQRGRGATLDGRPIRVRPYEDGSAVLSQPVRSKLPPGLEALGRTPYPRAMGAAALELALVAEGALDGFVNSGTLRIVDIAAGALLVEEAGGVVVGLDGKPLSVPLDLSARTGLVAAGDRQLLKTLGVGT